MFARQRVQREEPHREAAQLEPGGSEPLSVEEEEESTEKIGQQRDASVLMADTPSPAPSVISIHSELTDGEEERDDEEPRLHA